MLFDKLWAQVKAAERRGSLTIEEAARLRHPAAAGVVLLNDGVPGREQ
jgi:hypothetical protein